MCSFLTPAIKKNWGIWVLFLFGAALFPLSSMALEEYSSEFSSENIYLLRGDLETRKASGLVRISVADPEVVDVTDVTKDQFVLLAKRAGNSAVFIFDDQGKKILQVRVFDEDLDLIEARLKDLIEKSEIPDLSIEKSKLEGKVIISGDVDKKKERILDKVLESFDREHLVRLVKEKEPEELVQVDVQLVELNTSYTRTLGIDWTSASALSFKETVPGIPIDKPWDALKIGEFKRTTAMTSVLNALITEGKARILSRPKLVVVSGEEADFQVGGQVPVVTRTITGNNILENVIYRDYGISMRMTPTVTPDRKIDLKFTIDESDIDASTPVLDQVSFVNRTANTQLFLEDGQTIVLAGLIKRNKGENVSRIPFFSDIPVFGALFRNRTTSPDKDTELVISLSPTILTPPTDSQKNASRARTSALEADRAEEKDVKRKAYLAEEASFVEPAVSIPRDMLSYVQQIQTRMAESAVYPEKAKRYGWEGTVKVVMNILKDGTLVYALVRESSGYDLFDENALTIAKQLAPYASFPSEAAFEDITVTIPIVYSLETR